VIAIHIAAVAADTDWYTVHTKQIEHATQQSRAVEGRLERRDDSTHSDVSPVEEVPHHDDRHLVVEILA